MLCLTENISYLTKFDIQRDDCIQRNLVMLETAT